jgi:hypothetical protein
MSRASTNSVLQAAAKSLAWELFSKAGYCRTRTFVDVEKFDRELLSAVNQWRAVLANLKAKRRKRNGRNERIEE